MTVRPSLVTRGGELYTGKGSQKVSRLDSLGQHTHKKHTEHFSLDTEKDVLHFILSSGDSASI